MYRKLDRRQLFATILTHITLCAILYRKAGVEKCLQTWANLAIADTLLHEALLLSGRKTKKNTITV